MTARPSANPVACLLGACWILALPATLAAQPRPDQPRPMRFERLSLEDGLSQSIVYCIFQDTTGFLWLGTQGGLNRYDGYRFEVYRHDPEDPTSLPHDWIIALAEDPSGDLWVGTQGGGVARSRQRAGTFTTYRHDSADPRSVSGDEIMAFAFDHEGALWVATHTSGLNRFDEAAGTFERFRHDPADPTSLSHDQLGTLLVDRTGNLWVGTWGGLDRFDPITGGFVHYRHDPANPESLSDDRVRALTEDPDGGLWVGTHRGLNRLEGGPPKRAASGVATGRVERFLHDPADRESLSHDWVRSLLFDRDGRLWIGTDGGLNRWREESRGFAGYHTDAEDPQSLGSDQIPALFEDQSGILWISTVGSGLSKWNPGTWSFSHYRPSAGEEGASDFVLAISENRAGGVWTGTFGGGLERLERDSGRRVRYRHDPTDPTSLADDRVTALLYDRADVLWIGTVGGGLHRLDPGGEGFEHFRHDPDDPESLSADAVTALHQNRDGRLWIATWTAGLNLWRGDGAFTRYRHGDGDRESLGHDRVFSLAGDAAGRLWVATDGGGLHLLPADPEAIIAGRFRRFRHDPDDPESLASDELVAVHVDGSDRVWVGTKASGLDRLVSLGEGRAEFVSYSTAEGLPHPTVWGILSDDAGYLWLSTGRGLARFEPESETFRSYDTSHGLQSNEFNQGAYFQSTSGELFFGGVNGWSAFFPDQIQTNDAIPPVVLTGLTRFNQPLAFGLPLFDVRELDFAYDDHFLAFEFAALDFTAPEKNRYRYRLEGFDDAWIDLGSERRVTFASLAPGDYGLRVQGSNNDGVWNEEGLTLTVRVAPPYWQTWWFRALLAVTVLAATFSGYRFRTRQIRRINERLQALVALRTRELEEAHAELVKKERLATVGELAGGIAHEIRTPLSIMQNTLYLLGRLLADDRAKKLFGRIEEQIRRTDRIVRELLDYTRGSNPDQQPFVLQEVAGQALDELEVPPTVRVERRFDAEPVRVDADPYQVQRILANLLTNALQAMPEGGELRLECARVGDQGAVSVIDTGVGIAAEDLPRVFEPLFTTKADGIGLGLAVSQRYARLNRGRIECDSLDAQGAIFRLLLPAMRDDRPAAGDGNGD